MLRSTQKPFEEILGSLEGESKVFVVGCDGWAQSSGSGGPEQVAEMVAAPVAALVLYSQFTIHLRRPSSLSRFAVFSRNRAPLPLG